MERDARIRTAADLMTRKVFALRPESPARDAVLALVQRGFSGAPVVDSEHRLLGVVSEHDLIRVLAAAAYDAGPAGTVRELMTSDVTTAAPETDVFELITLLSRSGFKRLPIVTDGRVMGLVTRQDIAGALVEICDERCGTHLQGTIDAMATLEEIHNPFPGGRRA